MAKLFNRYKWLKLITGILFLIAGILTIVIAICNVNSLSVTLSIVVAVMLFALGAFVILSTFLDDNKSYFTTTLFYGALIIALGVVFCIKPNFLDEIIIYFIAVFAIALGAILIVKGIVFIKLKTNWTWFVSMFVAAAICIGLGIVALVINKEDILRVVYIVAGASFVIAGLATTILGIKLIKNFDVKEETVVVDEQNIEE